MSVPVQFVDRWPDVPPLFAAMSDCAYMPVDPTDAELDAGVYCGVCGQMAPIRTSERRGVCWEIDLHGPEADPCPSSGLPCDGPRPRGRGE